jgi:aromatic ring hydroxylase
MVKERKAAREMSEIIATRMGFSAAQISVYKESNCWGASLIVTPEQTQAMTRHAELQTIVAAFRKLYDLKE